MPALFTLLFKINIALVLFCAGYYLVLRHLTFYTLNRIYLVAAILFSSIYPWINISGFMQRHQQLTAPVQNVILQWKAPAEKLVMPLNQPDYWHWAEVAFWTGVGLFALRLMMQLFSLYRLYRNSKPGLVHDYSVRLIDGNVCPFSFWRSIYVNPETLSESDLKKVLEHEHVHVSEWHTLDILLAELSTIFYWFNPGIWLMKKAVRENVEFITDRKILQKGIDSKQYQYSLLSVSMAGTPNNLVNNFNISTIKKRIIMMNTKRSSRLKLSRYAFVAPAVIILLLVFSISKAEIAKKGMLSIKSLTAAIKGVAISNDDRPIIHPMAKAEKNTGIPKSKPKSKTKAADTIYSGKSKDGKKNMLLTGDMSVDSVDYVINGARSTRADVKAIDPARIYSLELVPVSVAKKFIDFKVDKSNVLFVTTNDSEAGKKLKARLDKEVGEPALAYIVKDKGLAAGSNADIAPTPPPGATYSISSSSISSDSAPEVAIYSNNAVSASSVIVANPKVKVSADIKNHIYIKTAPVTVVSVNGDTMIAPKISGDEIISVDSNGVKHKTYMYSNSNKIYTLKAKNYAYATTIKPIGSPTIDGFSNKLIVIDGKVASQSDMNKLPASKISSISILDDDQARAKYGNKGEKGVIVITTKKTTKSK